jgi:splicing factor U2AF subunit
MTEETGEGAKVKQEKADDPTDDTPRVTGGLLDPDQHAKAEDKDKVKDEKKDEKKDGVKGENVKGEPSVKKESSFKEESVKGESAKNESVKGESAKNESVKGESAKNESTKSEPHVKSEAAKGETTKGESKKEDAKAELAKQEIKSEAKRERSRSAKKKDKKDKKVKKERGDSPGQKKKKDKKDKKRGRSGSPKDDRRKRKSKWGPDVPAGFSMTAQPGGRSGLVPMPSHEDNLPRFNDEETKVRTVVLENLPSHVTGQELIEFFNGAVLAVTANAVQQAANKSMAPVFSCTISEEDRGGSRKKVADLKFRTPDGASVGMKLNGIEYKGGKLLVKRPEGFPLEEGDPASKLNLHEMSMARLIGVTPGSGKVGGDGVSPKLSIFNLPEVMSEQIVRDLLSQFGKLRMMSLIRDLATGKIKGYGIFEYDDPNDVELAILALNGFVCGQNVIRVQKLGAAAQQGAAPKAQPVAATAMSNSMTQKIVSNPVLAMQVKQGREVGSRPTTVVQLTNAVYQEDLMDDQDYDEIMSEVHTMASKHGQVARVVIPKPNKDGTYVDGVGKIFVSFLDTTSARKFQLECNGRKFEHRVVCAAFYPVEKFLEGKFKLWIA